MKGTSLLISAVVFVAAIAVFSRGYGLVIAFFKYPTALGLLGIFFCLLLLILCLTILGFFMYASDRRAGNIKTKIRLFEKLLGFAENAELPKKSGDLINQEKDIPKKNKDMEVK